jgi:ectoine hydroxylase-related dioxygenase (phytanoyl-CoA dioxygenase family)
MTTQLLKRRLKRYRTDVVTKSKSNRNDIKEQCDNIITTVDEESNIVLRWTKSVAIFGDSVYALVAATIVFSVSIWISYRFGHGKSNDDGFSGSYQHQRSDYRTGSNQSSIASPSIYTSNAINQYESLGPIPNIDPPFIFTVQLDEMGEIQFNDNDTYNNIHDAFYKDGVVAIRGLLSEDLLRQLDDESLIVVQDLVESRIQQSIQTKNSTASISPKSTQQNKKKLLQFFTVKHRILFQNKNSQTLSAFANVAIRSAIPSLVAALHYNYTKPFTKMMENEISANGSISNDNRLDELLRSKTTQNIRVLRDIFLAKDNEQFVCGWHVDDMGFWPVTQDSPTGINVWVAIDDMPPSDGGGFAVAVQSHVAPWRNEAHIATGSSMHFPLPHGYTDASHMLMNRTGGGTCNIKQIAPHLHQRMEETSRLYDIRRGDIIIHTRWLFHRTIPFVDGTDSNSHIYRRYSIRYGPGSSRIPPGYGTEYSVLWNESNGGMAADDICNFDNDTPWYPLAWRQLTLENNTVTSSSRTTTIKSLNKEEELFLAMQFANLVNTKFPIAEKLAQQRQTEMQQLLTQQHLHHRS